MFSRIFPQKEEEEVELVENRCLKKNGLDIYKFNV
jgi:hypothetical protein